jgi:hypothetical protein
MSDDFTPALTVEPSRSSAETPAAPSAGGTDDPKVAPPDSTTALRDQRVVSSKVREFARQIAAQMRDSEDVPMGTGAPAAADESNELEPMTHDEPVPALAASSTAPAAVRPVAATPKPSVAPAAPKPPEPAAAPTLPSSASAAAEILAKAEAARQRQEYEAKLKDFESRTAEKEKALAEKERLLSEKEKALPGRRELVERPAAALSAYLKQTYGITDDAELKEVLSDIVTEVSEAALGIKLPDNIKTGLESRKALRSVRVYGAELSAREAALAAERESATKAQHAEAERQAAAAADAEAVRHIRELVATTADTHPYLHATSTFGIADNPADIIVEMCRDQKAKTGQVDWKTAVDLANEHYKPKVEAAIKAAESLRPRILPSAPAATPRPVVPQVTGEQVPRPRTLTTTPVAPAPAPAEDEFLPSIDDRHERRHAQARALMQRHRGRFQQP